MASVLLAELGFLNLTEYYQEAIKVLRPNLGGDIWCRVFLTDLFNKHTDRIHRQAIAQVLVKLGGPLSAEQAFRLEATSEELMSQADGVF